MIGESQASEKAERNLLGERWVWINGTPQLTKVYHNRKGLSQYRYPVRSFGEVFQHKTNHPGYETREACIRAHIEYAENRVEDLRAEIEALSIDLARSRQLLREEAQ